jgi:hypothetical protein
MNRSFWQILALAVGLTVAAVYWFSHEEPQASQAKLGLRQVAPIHDMAARRELLCRRWRWVRTVDPYQGGTTMTPSREVASRWLIFHEDGLYQREEGKQSESGLWRMGPQSARLALLNGPRATRETFRESDFRHEIRALTPDSLALAWQGRHGYVVEQYVAADPEREQGLSLEK